MLMLLLFGLFMSTTLTLAEVEVGGVVVNVPGLGDITGNRRNNVNEFLGIKFADAPRFGNPIDVSAFPSPYDATRRGPMCYQDCQLYPEMFCQTEGISEDCLFLNIFAPRGGSRNKCVMVFIHGGNFEVYSGAAPVLDGERFVSVGGCILVTINYRLGAFGFLGGRNLGLRDQIFALQWVHKHISCFGGNPNKITLFGESAGAQSVGTLMSIPEASQYFKRAILQSCPFTLSYQTAAEAEVQEGTMATLMGCAVGDLVCYNNIPAADVLRHQNSQAFLSPNNFLRNFQIWGPAIDGTLVKDNVLASFQNKQTSGISTIIGTMQDEGLSYAFRISPVPLQEAGLNHLLTLVNPMLDLNLIKLLYDVDSNPDKRFVLAEIARDYLFKCPSRAASRFMSGSRAFHYHFSDVFPGPVWGPGHICNSFSCHSLDLSYTFGVSGEYTFSKEQKDLSDAMIKYWHSFAKTGRPKSPRLPKWRRFFPWKQSIQNLMAPTVTSKLDNDLACFFLEHFVGFSP